MWAIFTGFWNFPPFSPFKKRGRKARDNSKPCKIAHMAVILIVLSLSPSNGNQMNYKGGVTHEVFKRTHSCLFDNFLDDIKPSLWHNVQIFSLVAHWIYLWEQFIMESRPLRTSSRTSEINSTPVISRTLTLKSYLRNNLPLVLTCVFLGLLCVILSVILILQFQYSGARHYKRNDMKCCAQNCYVKTGCEEYRWKNKVWSIALGSNLVL